MMIGQKLGGRYLIEGLIGEGATATVYKAQDTRLRRTVAVKVLLPHVPKATRERFESESHAVAQLNHPGIMAIYDVGTEREVSYLVTEYVTGKPLSDYIPAEPDLVARLGYQICLALDYAHRAGVIHRDIKPANIYVVDRNTPSIKLMDFGLAIPSDGKYKRVTAEGSIIGTPAYLSPEQAQGKTLTPHTDLYSLGIVLYEMATGRLPFDDDDVMQILIQQVKRIPDSPAQYNVHIPRWLEITILRAIEKDPSNRFATAADMAAALQPIRQDRDLRSTEETLKAAAEAKIKVVIVDDHAMIRKPLAAYLELAGNIEVVGEASDGQQAIELSRLVKPDVMLLDLNMPRMSGMMALPLLKQEFPTLRVLVLTGREESQYVMQALRNGANGYILKSAGDDELVKAVRDVFSGGLVLGSGVAEKIAEGLRHVGMADPLTTDEHDVIRYIAAGIEDHNKLAQKLKTDEIDVTRKIKRIIDKLGVENKTEAALMALRAGWILIEDVQNLL